jgi:hypothetical protein
MPDLIQEMRDRLSEKFSGAMKKPIQGLQVVTANNIPRLPQSKIPSPRPRYEKAGRPPEAKRQLPNIPRKKDIWGGWL